MFSETAELYDLIYQQFKDYTGESRRIAGLLERVHPEAALWWSSHGLGQASGTPAACS